MGPAGCRPTRGCFGGVAVVFVPPRAILADMARIHAHTYIDIPYMHIHIDTCAYIHGHPIHAYTYRYMHIHAYTCTYMHIDASTNHGQEGVLRSCSGRSRARGATLLPRSAETGLEVVMTCADLVLGTPERRRMGGLGAPNACGARGCAKSGLGVGRRWRNKVCGHMP